MSLISQITTWPNISVILTLLLAWQWHRQHAKEQSIRYNLLGLRRAAYRFNGLTDAQSIQHKTDDLTDWIDATLATLDVRMPYKIKLQEVTESIIVKFRRESKRTLANLPNELSEESIRLMEQNK